MTLRRVVVGVAAAASIAFAAKRAGSLNSSGALAATAVGTAVYSGLGVRGTVLMLGFFIPSSLLSKFAKRRRGEQDLIDKDGPRDARQVLANGGIAALCALMGSSTGGRLGFAAALAAASSDTWSTEIGTVFGSRPYSLLSGQPAVSGLSGNVSDAGYLGALAGSAWIAILAGMCRLADPAVVAGAGLAGSLADSAAGATLQALYQCTVCRNNCEVFVHCDHATELIRGYRQMNNDAVNLFAVCCAVLIAISTKLTDIAEI